MDACHRFPSLPSLYGLLALLPTFGTTLFAQDCVFPRHPGHQHLQAPDIHLARAARQLVEDPATAPGYLQRGSLAAPGRAAPIASTTGTLDNLVLLLRFSDHGPGGQDRTLPTIGDVTTIMNAVGGDPSLAPAGSVRDYFLESSYGALSIESSVVGWLELPETEAYYGNGSAGISELTEDMITAALELADDLVDFTDFDQDGDGWIDAITFLHSGLRCRVG